MIRKVCLLFSLLLAIMVFPAWGAMSDTHFVDLCGTGSAQEVKNALKNGANPNARSANGCFTALIWAARNNENPEVINVLVKAGADIHAKDCDDEDTALTHAAQCNNNLEVINALLKAGADANEADYQGITALMQAARCNTSSFVNRLIKAGAKVNAKDNWNGRTALMWAKRSIQMLLIL